MDNNQYNPNNYNPNNNNPNNYSNNYSNNNSNNNNPSNYSPNNNSSNYNPNNYNPGNYNSSNYGPQQPYNNPYYSRRPYDPNSEPMTLKDWILTFLMLMIPFAGLVLPFVWAFGNDVNKSKKTFFQAYLICMLIVLAIYVAIIIFIFSLTATFMSDLSGVY